MADYLSRHAMHSLSRKGMKAVWFHGGKFSTDDLETQKFIETHPAFLIGAIVRVDAPAPPAPKTWGQKFKERVLGGS